MNKKYLPMTELKLARIQAGFTQTDVAKIFGSDLSTISNHETGRTSVSILQLVNYAKLYKVEDYRDLCPSMERVRKFYK